MSQNGKIGIETERKYIIEMPQISHMEEQSEYTKSEILQIYLDSDDGTTHRIRRRIFPDRVEYTETKKRRINFISSEEDERYITKDEFDILSKKIKLGTSEINKTRHTFSFFGQTFEIDVYPEWKKTAIMETELQDADRKVTMPEFISILREVSGDKNYSNAGMARCFPQEIV